ncbi:trigger factor [Raoultibacter phocaeensis]|uniref:trigger factor n=1 Tax=Raoultibacter phocaeensis TaxID=2479841 RepID=UPI0015D5EB5C|nr:trigger factor [Raoultibacter phocaeensis]
MELQSVYDRIDDDRATLSITIKADDVNTLIDQFTIALAYQNNIAPEDGQDLAEAVTIKLGKEAVEKHLETSVMGYSFPFAAEGNHVEIVGKPALTAHGSLARDTDFSFEALCTLKPSFSLSSYDPVHITVPPLEVTDEDVERYLKTLAQSHAYLEEDTSHAEIRKGDLVELEIETFKDGVRCDQLCSESRTYTTGADMMPPDFDEQVMKMRVGETKTIVYEYPGFTLDENYEPQIEHYTSTVTAKKVQKMVVPELNDQWVRENMPDTDGVEGLRRNARETIYDRKSIEYRHYKNLQSANELVKRFDGEISPAVYEAVTADILQSFEDQLAQQETTKEDFLRQQGITEQQLMAHFSNQVREQLVRQFALDAVAEHFGLEVDDADLDEYFRAAASPGLEAMIRLDFERNGRMPEARLSALRLKANDYVTEHSIMRID